MSYRSRSRDRYDAPSEERHRDGDRRMKRESERYDDRRDDRHRDERRGGGYDDRGRTPPRRHEDDHRSPRRDDRRSGDRRSGDRRSGDRGRSRSPLPKRVSRDSNGAPIPAPPSTCVGVFGLHRDTTQKEFEYQMAKFGRIAHVVLVWNHRDRCNKGFGFITYEEIRDAEEAVKQMNDRHLDGRKVRVDFSFSKVGNKEHMYDQAGRRKTEYCDPEYRKPRYPTPDRMRGSRRSRSRSYERSRDRRSSRDRY